MAEITIESPNIEREEPKQSPANPLGGWIFWVWDQDGEEYSNTYTLPELWLGAPTLILGVLFVSTETLDPNDAFR